MILDFYSVNWSGESSAELGKLGVPWWIPWLSVIIKIFIPWLSNLLIIRLFPYLDYRESMILQKTWLNFLFLVIKSTYQGWYLSFHEPPYKRNISSSFHRLQVSPRCSTSRLNITVPWRLHLDVLAIPKERREPRKKYRGLNSNFCSWTSWTKYVVHVFMNGSWTGSNFSRSFFVFEQVEFEQVHEHVHEQIEFEKVQEQFTTCSSIVQVQLND